MDNFYLLHPGDRWAAVCIAKNACTSLKRVVLAHAGTDTTDLATIHNTIGYDSGSPFLSPVSGGRPPGLFSFAIWRDPVSRFASVYQHFALDGFLLNRVAHLPRDNFDAWLDHASYEFSHRAIDQEEHFRRQSDHYQLGDVDLIVRLEHADAFFNYQGWTALPRENKSIATFEMSQSQRDRACEIFEPDIALLAEAIQAGRVWDPTHPGLQTGGTNSI